MSEPTGRPRARDAIGMPVPPAWAIETLGRARGLVGQAEARMGAPFQLVLERLFGILDNKALFMAVQLGVPDVLADGPRSVATIAASTGAETDALHRILRYLVSRGFFRVRGDDRYANSATTDILRSDHPYSWRDWVLFLGSAWSWQIFNELPARVAGDGSACERALGSGFFEYVLERDPDAGRVFNGAQAAGARVQGLLFAEHYDFSGVTTVCDVGGGTGSVLASVLRTHPDLRGVVVDLASLAGEAAAVFTDAGLDDRAVFRAGDFFASVPAGFDLYLLFAVIHDWGDDQCVQILGNIRAALPAGGRVAVVERHLRPRGADFAKASDLLMLALTDGGRERSLAELDSLFRRAGLTQRHRVTLPSLFDVFELVAADPTAADAER